MDFTPNPAHNAMCINAIGNGTPISYLDSRHHWVTYNAHRLSGRRVLTYPEIERRYPLLIASMQWAAILTTTEATDCIRALKEQRGSGEAVQHFGGPVEVFKAALRCRRYAYDVLRYKRSKANA